MERLTERHKYNGKEYVSVDRKKYGISCSNFCSNCGKADCDDVRKALFKLAEYEDLEEQGKLLKLPCAVGDKIWSITSTANYSLGYYSEVPLKHPEEKKIQSITLSKNGCLYHVKGRTYSEFDFGKTVFLTKSAAEQALKEMEGKNG